MRINREDSTDLGMVTSCLMMGAITKDEVSIWASSAIDEEEDAPTFLYTMLDLQGLYGRSLREEIGFDPSGMDFRDNDYDYLCQIAVRRGLEPYSYLGPAADVTLSPEREKSINDLFKHNFGIDVEKLPPLSSFKP